MNRSKYKPGYFKPFPLHYAAANGHVVEVQRQLDAGANPYKPTEEGLTALHAAVVNRSVAVVDVLLQRFAEDLSIVRDTLQHRFRWKVEQEEWKRRPILVAWTEEECQAALAVATSCPGGIPLMEQVFVFFRHPQQGHTFIALDVCNRSKRTRILQVIQSLLPNGIISLDRSDMRKNCVNYLHMACSHSKPEVIAKLVSNGASLAVHSGDQNSTPFMAACEALRMDIVEFLTKNYFDHFDPGACDSQDRNALHKVLQRQNTSLAEPIVQHMLKYRMTKNRETVCQAIASIFRYDSVEYKYLTIWYFVQSNPVKNLCAKYIKLGQMDLQTRYEDSSLLEILISRGIALDYCLQEIEHNVDLLRIENNHSKNNILHDLIRCAQLKFVKVLYEKHEEKLKEIFEKEDSQHKPAFGLLRTLMQKKDETAIEFVLERHKDYYVKYMDHLLYSISKQHCMTVAGHAKLCEIVTNIIPQLKIALDEVKNSKESLNNDFYEMYRSLSDKYESTVNSLEANGKRLEDYIDGDGRTFLHFAAEYGENCLVEKLLARNFDLMKKDAKGCIPIQLVRRDSIFEMLLARYEPHQWSCVNEDGYNLLHIASRNGLRGGGLEKLLEHGLDVNGAAPDGHVPLSLAPCCGTVRFLLKRGARAELLNDQLFSDRLSSRQYCAAWELIPHIAQLDWFKKCAHRLLPWMVGNQSRDFFSCSNERELEKHADIRRVIFDSLYEHSKEKASELFSRVCHNAIVSCSRWFLEYNYDIDYNYREWGDSTPLMGLLSYMEEPNSDIVEKLLQKPIDVNAVNEHGRNAFITLASHYKWKKHYGHSIETFRLLLKHGSKLDVQDHSGNTALHYAFEFEQWDLVELLIESGANMSLKNESNKLPYEMIPAFSRYLYRFMR